MAKVETFYISPKLGEKYPIQLYSAPTKDQKILFHGEWFSVDEVILAQTGRTGNLYHRVILCSPCEPPKRHLDHLNQQPQSVLPAPAA